MALAATWVPSKRPMWNYVIATAARSLIIILHGHDA
jgi:hypothetical protein